jgi:tetratricopeptide (TPR) repeat protein
MKFLLTISFSLFTFACFAQTMSYKEWNRQAKTDMRLLPKYGNQPKNDKQKLADQELIDESTAREGNRRKASEAFVKTGFSYLYKGDLKSAMSRFNQAWLLDPENENAFWGFGAIYYSFQDIPNALKQFDEGLILNPRSSNILTDKGTIYMSKYHNEKDTSAINTAIGYFNNSYEVDSLNQNTAYKLSVAYFTKKDCDNAWKFYDVCKKMESKYITEGYTNALTQNCKK